MNDDDLAAEWEQRAAAGRKRTRQRAMMAGLAILGLVGVPVTFWGFMASQAEKDREKAAAEASAEAAQAKARADEGAKARAQNDAEDRAYAMKFDSIRASFASGAPTAKAEPSLVRGRKALGLIDGGLFKSNLQKAGGAVHASTPEEVGIVVLVTRVEHTDRPSKYLSKRDGRETPLTLYPNTFTFRAIAWPEKKLVAEWTREKMPKEDIAFNPSSPGGSTKDAFPFIYLDGVYTSEVATLQTGKVP